MRVIGGRDVVVERATIRWAGLRAASFIDAIDSGIISSDIADTGEGGVLLKGGDRRTLTPARLFVRDCRIVRFSRIGRTFRPAVDMHGVGNIVAQSYIAEAPNFGIQFQGNDHLTEGNEITDVVNDTSDAGAIYTGVDWTARGTIIRGNFIHDIQPGADAFEVKGVYLDDFTSGTIVEGNLFLRVQQPVFIGGGRDNVVRGNVFIASPPAVFIDSRGLDWASKFVVDENSDLRRRLAEMPIASEPWRSRFPQLMRLLADAPGDARGNVSRGNLIVGRDAYQLEVRAVAAHQSLGPDLGASRHPSGFERAKIETWRSATTAGEVGKAMAAEIAEAGWPSIDFAAMDRARSAGRRHGIASR